MAEKPAQLATTADASFLIGISAIGRIDLLQAMFERVCVAGAVWEEVVVVGSGRVGAEEVRQATVVERRDVANRQRVAELCEALDLGEAETIALAEELSCTLALIDERKARREAERAGLQCMGVVGMLVEAKARGLVHEIRPLLDQLQASGFHLNTRLVDWALGEAGEV